MGGHVRFKNGIDAYVHNKPSPRDGIEVVCEKGVYHTGWTEGHLWRGEPRSPLIEDKSFFDEFGGTDDGWTTPSGTRQKGGIHSIVDSLDKGIEPRCSGANMRKVLEIAIGFRESHRNDFAAIKFPIEDRSLKIVPHQGRFLNKKEVYGEEAYAKMIGASVVKPVDGALVQ
jgi:hypothetical protein